LVDRIKGIKPWRNIRGDSMCKKAIGEDWRKGGTQRADNKKKR